MTAFVVDASMAASWVLPDERSVPTDLLLDQVEADGGIAPSVFWHEVRNILLKVERRGRGQRVATEAALRKLRRLPLDIVDNRDDAVVLGLARDYSLSAYDASYLGIAILSGLPLATADRRLAAGTHASGVIVFSPYARTTP